MNGFQILLFAILVNAAVLGICFVVLYQFNKAANASGR